MQAILHSTYIQKRKDKPENYRPISLTSHIIKVFERILKNKLVVHLEANKFVGDFQHGFRTGRSCLTQLISHYTKILEHINHGSNVDVVYLNFARAFDKVDHDILLTKLEALKIGGSILT